MAVKPHKTRRKLIIATLVMMTLLPLIVYFYLRERGRELAAQRVVQHVEESVHLTLQLKDQLEAVLGEAGAGSRDVAERMERLAATDDNIAYIQLADGDGRVLNSTSGAPGRKSVAFLLEHVALRTPEVADPAVVRRLDPADELGPPEFALDLRLSPTARGHVLVGLSARSLDARLREFQRPARLSALQISILCVSILACFSAYIMYLNERARALRAQLEEESRLAYVGTLASSIAHEVRNPLSSMKINAQMLERRAEGLADPADAEYFRTKIHRIKGEVDRLEESVSHFLAFARPAPLRPESVGVNGQVNAVLGFLEPECHSRNVRLVRKLGRDLPRVHVDPRQFAQAIQNLVLNAAQAIGAGGTVTVETEAAADTVAITVADDGPGIPPELQEKVFDVFFTTREGGTGLGLNIVSRIVEEHRGTLSLDSRPGRGARFRIALPVPPAAPEPPPSPDGQEGP